MSGSPSSDAAAPGVPAAAPDRQAIGRLATALAGVGVFNAGSIILMYAGLPIFGPLNDLGVATAAILQAVLAWRVRGTLGVPALRVAVAAATIGAGVAAVGSGMVISGTTDWFVAGLVSTLGYALLGCWMVAANRRARRNQAWPGALASLGLLSGGITLIGLLALPALARGAGSLGSAPWYAWAAYANGVGWFILLPFWNWRLGRYLKTGASA